MNHSPRYDIQVDGQELPLTAVPSLEVKVQSALVHEPPIDENSDEVEFPTHEPFKTHPSVTRGRLGGLSSSG